MSTGTRPAGHGTGPAPETSLRILSASAIGERVAAACDEAVHIAVLDGADVVYVTKVDSTHPVRMVMSPYLLDRVERAVRRVDSRRGAGVAFMSSSVSGSRRRT